MRSPGTLGPWLRRFLEEHLVTERNLARNTQLSYRDTLVLLLPFVADRVRKPVDRLALRDVSAECVLAFLRHVEEVRGCSARTRNQRLGAIRALARYVASRAPEQVEWCGQIRAIPLKKAVPRAVAYLEKPEIEALLEAPSSSTEQGRRERALLQFLYSTGARVSEAAGLRVGDLQLTTRDKEHSLATLRGKGGKTRRCPLLHGAAVALAGCVQGRAADDPVFLNRRGQPITRSGIRQMVQRCTRKAAERVPSLAAKRVSPHVIRHTTATHLLRSGVDINTIRAWLGHARIDTTTIYAEIDTETKAKALSLCDPVQPTDAKPWREDVVMDYLRSL